MVSVFASVGAAHCVFGELDYIRTRRPLPTLLLLGLSFGKLLASNIFDTCIICFSLDFFSPWSASSCPSLRTLLFTFFLSSNILTARFPNLSTSSPSFSPSSPIISYRGMNRWASSSTSLPSTSRPAPTWLGLQVLLSANLPRGRGCRFLRRATTRTCSTSRWGTCWAWCWQWLPCIPLVASSKIWCKKKKPKCARPRRPW